MNQHSYHYLIPYPDMAFRVNQRHQTQVNSDQRFNASTITLQWKNHQLSSFIQVWKVSGMPQSGSLYFMFLEEGREPYRVEPWDQYLCRDGTSQIHLNRGIVFIISIQKLLSPKPHTLKQ